MSTTEHQKLFKKDTTGKIRVWWSESEHDRYRTHSGILDGKIVTSGWIYPDSKNVGKTNETTIQQQVLLEIESEYTKKTNQGKYHPTLEETSKGAKFFEPMLAQKYDPKKSKDFPYFSQSKLDGLRCLVSKNSMQSRNGKEFVSSPHILESLKEFFEAYPNVVTDGEIYNHDLKSNFEKIVSLARKTKPTDEDIEESRNLIQYHVYDVMGLDSNADFTHRLKFLNRELNEFLRETNNQYVKIVKTNFVRNEDELQKQMAEYISEGYEGQMLRIPNSLYEHKRSKSLLKHKEFDDDEFKVVDVIEGVGNWSGMAKAIVIQLDSERTQESGMRGNFEEAKNILMNADKLKGTTVTVRYQGKTSEGKLRFPIVTKFWWGDRNE
jgi:DNA ligase-1